MCTMTIPTECYISYEDPRYQTLVLYNPIFGSVGYSIDLSTGGLERICICAAHNASECCCGYDFKYDNLLEQM